MENENIQNKNTLMEKVMRFSLLLRRLCAPQFGSEGPRGRSQERALTQIALRDGISQRELLEKLGIQPSSLSELLGKLEKGGMIERRQSEDDHRQVNIHISEAGKRYLERVNDRSRHLIPFDALSGDEQDRLSALLDKLIGSAENACQAQGLPMFPPRPREFGPDFRPHGAPGRFPHDLPRRCPPPHGMPGRFPREDELDPDCLPPRPPVDGVEREDGEHSEGARPFGGFRRAPARPIMPRPVPLPNLHPRRGGDDTPAPVQLADSGEKPQKI